jgi:hypothetical protein
VGVTMLKNRACRALLLTSIFVVSMVAVGVSSASATPTGEYAVFAQCPVGTPHVKTCIVARTESGEVKLGNQGVPIVNTQTLQGGLIKLNTFESSFAEALNKETLTKTAQRVPGGLLGIKCSEIKGEWLIEKGLRYLCEKLFEEGLAGVYATTELAAPASSIILNQPFLEIEEGTALYLPVKVKLENALFGSECYVGSSSEPIKLELTSGTSGTLKGKLGELSTKAEGGILVVKNNTIVDSAFAAPEAKGCGIGGILDGLINSKLGLPAKTGNTAVLNNTIEEANAEQVEGSE